jgi:hypothetical protein
VKFVVKYRNQIAGLVLISLMFIVYGKYANSLPLGVHNWAQSDRYSVAVMYQQNSNFLKAQTQNLSTIDGRTGVEFPALQYISARYSLLSNGSNLPFIYRLINLVILLGGLRFFIKQWNTNWATKLLSGVAFFCSPVLLFYGFNFLPDTTGLGLLLFAFGYFVRFTDAQKAKHAAYAIMLAALATLLKTTCGIYFLGLTAAIGIFHLKPLKLKQGLLLLGVFSICSLFIWTYDYYFFHKVNEDFYARVFMSKKQPLNTFADYQGLWKAFKYWHGQYLTWPLTLWIIGLIGLAIYHRKRLKPNKTGAIFITISFIGLMLFLKLMGKQFSNHDYYFITAFMPLLAMVLWYLTTIVPLNTPAISFKWIWPVLTVVTISALCLSIVDYESRMSSHFVWKHRDIVTDIEWMQNGEQIIDELGISDTATIFIGYDAAPNTALVYFNRLGKAFNHEEMTRDSSNMMYWSERIQPHYYIFPTAWVSKLEQDQPWLHKRLVLFAKRPRFNIYKPITN